MYGPKFKDISSLAIIKNFINQPTTNPPTINQLPTNHLPTDQPNHQAPTQDSPTHRRDSVSLTW